MPQIGLLIYLAGICLPVQIIESYTCVSQRIGCNMSHLTCRTICVRPLLVCARLVANHKRGAYVEHLENEN